MSGNIYDNTSVKEITPKELYVSGNYLKLRDDNNKALVKFYAPWCGYCTKLKGTLSKLADDGYIIYAINCDKYKDGITKLTENTDVKINGYPSIFIKGKDNILQPYQGGREENDFKKHLDKQTGGSNNGFEFIINPKTNRKVNIYSRKGRSILRNYINYFNNY